MTTRCAWRILWSPPKQLLDLIGECHKTAALQVHIQRAKAVFYTNNEISETEARAKSPPDTATGTNKYLGINLTEDVEDLYSEHYTTRKKELKKGTN